MTKYRVKEQFGNFYIEKEVNRITYEYRYKYFPFLGDLFTKEKIVKEWKVISKTGNIVYGGFNEAIVFKTKEDAVDYIPKLEPKYHEV